MMKCLCCSLLAFSACSFDGSNQANETPLADAQEADAQLDIDGASQGDAQASDASPEGCQGILATFEDIDASENPAMETYAGLEFDSSWTGYGAGQFNAVSASIAFSSNRPAGEFEFEDDERVLHGLRISWSGQPVTVTISDPDNAANADIVVSLDAAVPNTTVETNWTNPSTLIVVESTANWEFFLDDICHTSP